MKPSLVFLAGILGLLLISQDLNLTSAAEPDRVSYSRQIAPILALRCSGCHSSGNRWWVVSDGPEHGLDVGSYASLMKGGERGEAIVPGKPEKSRIIKHLESDNPVIGAEYTRMPFVGEPLSAGKIELIKKWIKQGAKEDKERPASIIVTLAKVPLGKLEKQEKTVRVACRLPIEGFATIAIYDEDKKRVLAKRSGAVRETKKGENRDLGAAASVGEWLNWSIKPLTIRGKDVQLPPSVTVDLVIEHQAGSLHGTEFGIVRGENYDLKKSYLKPNPASLRKDRPGFFYYRLDGDADVKIEIAKLESQAEVLFRDEKIDVMKGLREYKWSLQDGSMKDVKPGKYVARFRCNGRNPNAPVNDVCIVFEVLP